MHYLKPKNLSLQHFRNYVKVRKKETKREKGKQIFHDRLKK